MARTEGWAAGVYLAPSLAATDRFPNTRRRRPSHPTYIAEYLRSELLAGLARADVDAAHPEIGPRGGGAGGRGGGGRAARGRSHGSMRWRGRTGWSREIGGPAGHTGVRRLPRGPAGGARATGAGAGPRCIAGGDVDAEGPGGELAIEHAFRGEERDGRRGLPRPLLLAERYGGNADRLDRWLRSSTRRRSCGSRRWPSRRAWIHLLNGRVGGRRAPRRHRRASNIRGRSAPRGGGLRVDEGDAPGGHGATRARGHDGDAAFAAAADRPGAPGGPSLSCWPGRLTSCSATKPQPMPRSPKASRRVRWPAARLLAPAERASPSRRRDWTGRAFGPGHAASIIARAHSATSFPRS